MTAFADTVPVLSQPIKRHGGKNYLAKRIIALMPPRCKNPNAPAADDPGWVHYVEPYFGGGAVLMAQDPEGIGEVVNDVDGDLTNFWKVLADERAFATFRRLVEATPCSEIAFVESMELLNVKPQSRRPDPRRAVAFFVINRQSRQALGKSFSTLARKRTRRGMNELPSAWLSSVDGLPEVHARLQRVVILSGKALRVISQQDGPRTLFYLDPPYLHGTRAVTDAYLHEMTRKDHIRLLKRLAGIKGRFILSGYPSRLYSRFALEHGWHCVRITIDNKASGSRTKQKKTECLWMNYQPEQIAKEGA